MNSKNENSQGLNEEEINNCMKDCFRVFITLFLIISLSISGIIGLAYCSKFIGDLLSAILTDIWLIIIFIKMDWLIRIINRIWK